LQERLLESIFHHVELLERARRRGVNWDDEFELYAVLHALQVHAQSVIDYLLHTCALMGAVVETPTSCISELRARGLIDEEESTLLKRLVRFRNLIVHEYGSVDVERVKRVVEGGGYRVVADIIKRLHEKLREEGLVNS